MAKKNKKRTKIYNIAVNSESGDDFGVVTLFKKPTESEIKKILYLISPGDCENLECEGPGAFGTWLHYDLTEDEIFEDAKDFIGGHNKYEE